jgi:hypothetical protein
MTDQVAAIAAIVVLVLTLLAPAFGALLPRSHDTSSYMPGPAEGVLPFQ